MTSPASLKHSFIQTIEDICHLPWSTLSEQECIDATWAYYYFSVQFRENLKIARHLYPDDDKLLDLEAAECDTDNLSPWPGVAATGERMDHDEFMRRSLALGSVTAAAQARFEDYGQRYLALNQSLDATTRAMSIASYEDGGLEQVFTAMLTMQAYPNPILNAFRHFLSEHIRFDSDPDEGHGALARHLGPDDRIKPLWDAFHDLFTTLVPSLACAEVAVA